MHTCRQGISKCPTLQASTFCLSFYSLLGSIETSSRAHVQHVAPFSTRHPPSQLAVHSGELFVWVVNGARYCFGLLSSCMKTCFKNLSHLIHGSALQQAVRDIKSAGLFGILKSCCSLLPLDLCRYGNVCLDSLFGSQFILPRIQCLIAF